MSSRNLFRISVVIACLLLCAPAARAESPQGLLGPVWSWLSALWGDLGPCIDPNGGNACVQAKAGPCIDPDGRNACVQAKARGCINPDGSDCAQAPVQPKARVCIDPNGADTVCVP